MVNLIDGQLPVVHLCGPATPPLAVCWGWRGLWSCCCAVCSLTVLLEAGSSGLVTGWSNCFLAVCWPSDGTKHGTRNYNNLFVTHTLNVWLSSPIPCTCTCMQLTVLVCCCLSLQLSDGFHESSSPLRVFDTKHFCVGQDKHTLSSIGYACTICTWTSTCRTTANNVLLIVNVSMQYSVQCTHVL